MKYQIYILMTIINSMLKCCMRILVTGSKGQLAGDIISLAAQGGAQVAAHDMDTMDITDIASVSDIVREEKPEFIINCAAYNDVDGAESNWEDANLANGIGVKNLALAAKEQDAVLVHFSTDFVFNGRSKKPYTIADLPDPISSYGQSKLLGEEMTRQHAARSYIIRTSWLFGHGNFSFPLKVKQWAEQNDTLRIVDDQVASPTYSYDLAEAVLKLIATGSFGLYHITNSGHCSRHEWAKYILDSIGYKGTLIAAKSSEFKTAAKRPAFSVLDNFPLAQTIGNLLPSWKDATDRFLKTRGDT
jgi:dTDP-4-dehydrorhamnose reductase